MGQRIRTWYNFETPAGTFRIAQVHGGWGIWFEDEQLMGRYPSPQQALDDLAGGHTDWPSCGDPALLGISDDLGDWQQQLAPA